METNLPKILFCSFEALRSGPTALWRRISEYRKALEGHCTLHFFDEPADHEADLPHRFQAFDRALRSHLQTAEYALVHALDAVGGYPLCRLKEQLGFKLVQDATRLASLDWSDRFDELRKSGTLLTELRRRELYCLTHADRVLTGSWVGRKHLRTLGVAESSIEVLAAPTDIEAYAGKQSAPTGSPVRLIYLGNQAPWQGLETLLKGLAQAKQATAFKLSLAGPDWNDALRRLAQELGVADEVNFLPPVGCDELPTFLQAFDVGLVCLEDVERCRSGGDIAKASEYLAAGLPVLASDLPLCRTSLPESATVFFRPGDGADLAQKLVDLAQNPARRKSLGQVGRAEAIKKFSGKTVGQKLHHTYQMLLGRTPAGPPKVSGLASSSAGSIDLSSARGGWNPWVAQVVYGYCPPDNGLSPLDPGKPSR